MEIVDNIPRGGCSILVHTFDFLKTVPPSTMLTNALDKILNKTHTNM